MQIVWDKDAIEQLKKTHTLLELETFEVKGESVTTYCVVPLESLGINGLMTLDKYRDLHSTFVNSYYEKNYKLCQDLSEHLIGQFGGELDTFYQEILARIQNS
jgi:hypothetical protein